MERYRIKPGTRVKLDEWDPDDHGGYEGGKKEAEEELPKLNARLTDLQELLYAEHKHKILIVLQAMDTAGKDGVISHVYRGVNPQGVRVANFKAPTPLELDHDFLWRVHGHAPGTGEMVIFNRSHYEEVLVVRVHELVPEKVWRRRYQEINNFEELLANEGTTIIKFFLNIDPDEQKKRLQARLDDPKKQWKFNVGDLAERKLWPEYMKAYEDAIGETSTAWAPWYIVPANSKWFRDLVVVRVMLKTLEGLKMAYPKPAENLDRIVIE
ncbi:MAG TPA: polyphosphate kinase 2 family protein [Anaerolineae bacterium]